MNYLKIFNGKQVSLERILQEREERFQMQQQMLSGNGTALITFTLNIAGPVKLFYLAECAFKEGVREIQCRIQENGFSLLHKEIKYSSAGHTAFFMLNDVPEKVKLKMLEIEESHPIGRLFDIDVLCKNGGKVERESVGYEKRKCILCGNEAHICSRSRVHLLDDIQKRTAEILFCFFKDKELDYIAEQAVNALLYEVSVTPKPGLVDRNNNGAHHDMDIHTFIRSANVLRPWFRAFAKSGMENSDTSNEILFENLRKLGIQAENAMFTVTNGVNTHKGLIFSMAFVCAALGKMFASGQKYLDEAISKECASLAQYALNDFNASDIREKKSYTNGEKIYLKYGNKGVRQEAASGFPLVLQVGLPALKKELSKGRTFNDAAAVTLIAIMAEAFDTNIVARSSLERAGEIRKEMKELYALLDHCDSIQEIFEMDKKFIGEWISPGGSADILALTIMFYLLHIEFTKI